MTPEECEKMRRRHFKIKRMELRALRAVAAEQGVAASEGEGGKKISPAQRFFTEETPLGFPSRPVEPGETQQADGT